MLLVLLALPLLFCAALAQSGAGNSAGVASYSVDWNVGRQQLIASILAQEGTPTPHQNSVMASPPTITNTSSQPSGLTQCNSWPNNVGQFGYWGGASFTYGGNGRMFPVATRGTSGGNVTGGQDAVSWRVEAQVTSAKFAWAIYTNATNFRLIVNGQYTSLTGYTPASGSVVYLTLDFTSIGGSAPRDIILEGEQAQVVVGICSSPGDVVAYPSTFPVIRSPLRIITAGDSITAGSGPTYQNDGPIPQLCEQLGASDCWASGVGGTGFVDTTGSLFILPQRVLDTASFCRYVAMTAMGVNDVGTVDQPTEQAAATTVLSAYRAQCPQAIIIVIGPWDQNAPSAPATGYAAIKTALINSCAGVAGCFFIDVQGLAYEKASGPHPTAAGATTMANFVYAAIKAMLGIS